MWQEENKIIDRMHRVKVSEVEKLSQTICELEEAILTGGAAVNALHDYEWQVYELMVRSYFLSYTLPIHCTAYAFIS